MFPDLEDEDDISTLPSWGLPGYTQSMATPKGSKGKSAAGNTAKRATTTKTASRKKAK